MTGKFLLVSILFIFSGIVYSDSIPEQNNAPQFLFKVQKESPTAEKLKSSFQNSSKINLWSFFWKILFIFILLVSLIVVISRLTNGSPVLGKNLYGNNQFKILCKQYLSSRQKILLVKSFNKYILLGVTDQSINKITEFDEHEIDEESLMNSQSQSFFNSILGRQIQNGK